MLQVKHLCFENASTKDDQLGGGRGGGCTTKGLLRNQVWPASSPSQVDRSPSYFGGLPTVISPRIIRYTTRIPASTHFDALSIAGLSPSGNIVDKGDI